MSPQSASEWLGEWFEEEFGVRDERLVTHPDLDEAVAAAREELHKQLATIEARREELRETYRRSLEEAAGLDDQEDRRNELAREAKAAKKKYRFRSRQLARLRLRLSAVLVVDALRAFDGVPEPGLDLSEALFDRFTAAERDVSGFGVDDIHDRTDTVREALDFDIELWPTFEEPETTGFPGEHTGHFPGEERPDDGLDEEEIELADEPARSTPDDDIDLDDWDGL